MMIYDTGNKSEPWQYGEFTYCLILFPVPLEGPYVQKKKKILNLLCRVNRVHRDVKQNIIGLLR